MSFGQAPPLHVSLTTGFDGTTRLHHTARRILYFAAMIAKERHLDYCRKARGMLRDEEKASLMGHLSLTPSSDDELSSCEYRWLPAAARSHACSSACLLRRREHEAPILIATSARYHLFFSRLNAPPLRITSIYIIGEGRHGSKHATLLHIQQ